MYQKILFDLDGTLTDSSQGIINSVLYALAKLGIEETDRKKLETFIGPPLADSFAELYGLSESACQEAIRYYRQYFADKGLFENVVYPDIPQVLSELKHQGKRLIVATSKPEGFSRQILEHFELADYFDFIAGATMDASRTKKEDVIAYALEELGITDTSQLIMIGDRKHDIIGATIHHMDSIGVLYGFGDKEELSAAGATYIVDSPIDLLKYL